MKLTTNKKFNQPKPLKKIVKKPNNQKTSEEIRENESENDSFTENSKGDEEIKVELRNSEILGKDEMISNISEILISKDNKDERTSKISEVINNEEKISKYSVIVSKPSSEIINKDARMSKESEIINNEKQINQNERMSKVIEINNNGRQSKVEEINKSERLSRFSEVLVKNGRPSGLTDETTRDETMTYIISPEQNYQNRRPSTEKKSIFAKEIEDFQREQKILEIEKPEILEKKQEKRESFRKNEKISDVFEKKQEKRGTLTDFWNNEQLKKQQQNFKFHTQTQEYSVRVYDDKNINVLKQDIRLENSTKVFEEFKGKRTTIQEIQKNLANNNKFDMIESYDMTQPFPKEIEQK